MPKYYGKIVPKSEWSDAEGLSAGGYWEENWNRPFLSSWIIDTRDWLKHWSGVKQFLWNELWPGKHAGGVEGMQYLWLQLCWNNILISLILSSSGFLFLDLQEMIYNTWAPGSPIFPLSFLVAPCFAQRVVYFYSHNTVYFLSFRNNTFPIIQIGKFQSIRKITVPKLD